MILNLKKLVVIELAIILIAVTAVILLYLDNNKPDQATSPLSPPPTNYSMLSSRINRGILEPQSFIILNFAPLREKIQSFISKNNYNISIYVENLRNGAYMGINEKQGFFPTSLNKLPVAILIMRKIENGELSFDTQVQIRDSDRTDSSGDLYKTEEKKLPLRIVFEKLLKESDNTALRVLMHYMDLEDLQLILDYYSIDIQLDYKVSSENVRQDLITPKSMSNLFLSLYFSTILEPQNSEYLLSLLKDTVLDIREIAELPEETVVAHKFGENYYDNNQYFHDCGIMYIEDSRIFYCIMTKDLEEGIAVNAIGFLVSEIYQYVDETKVRYEKYREQSNYHKKKNR